MSRNTIAVKNYLKIREDIKAAAAITPGMLVELTSDGEVQTHSDEGGNALIMVAQENALAGGLISTAYDIDDRVQVWVPTRGDVANMIVSNGQDVSVGDFLVSDGAGKLKPLTAADSTTVDTTQAIVGVALEAVDMSGSDAVDPNGRILVRIA